MGVVPLKPATIKTNLARTYVHVHTQLTRNQPGLSVEIPREMKIMAYGNRSTVVHIYLVYGITNSS